MTDKLDQQSIEALISYRLERAEESLKVADFNASGEFYNTAVNRLYYACYYAASALMVATNHTPATHNGVKVILNLNFIRPGLLEQKYGAIYQQLFEKRQSGDYEDFVYCDNEEYQRLKEASIQFVEALTRLIQK